MTALRVAILGTGALGGLYGARLVAAGAEVGFLLRSDYDHVREHGLRIESPWGDQHLRSPRIARDPAELGPVDVVCVCWKTTSNHHLAAALPPLLHAETVVLLLQNGLGWEQRVATDLPDHVIAGGLAFLCSNKVGPGHIHHLDYGRLLLAPLHGGDLQRLEPIAEALRAGSVPVELTADLATARWHKLVWNIPYNALCTILDCDTAVLMADPALRTEIAAIMHEVLAAAAASGHPLPAELVETMVTRTERMRPYLPSMLLDRRQGRPLEIEAMYRQPLAVAGAHDQDMPRTALLAAQLSVVDPAAGPGAPAD